MDEPDSPDEAEVSSGTETLKDTQTETDASPMGSTSMGSAIPTHMSWLRSTSR